MMFLIPVFWVVFAINGLDRLAIYLNRMFPVIQMDYVANVNPTDYLSYGRSYILLFVLATAGCIPGVRKRCMLLQRSRYGTVVTYVIFVLCLYFLALGMDNPFLYYKF